MTPSLYGLVLAGGRSTRMKRDKATLSYHGRSQLEWAVDLLAPHVQKVFVSVRPDQAGDPARARFAQIIDRVPDLGPIAGIAAAQATHPEAAWLVLACDLPFLDAATLDHLITHRDPARIATAYRSSHDGLPEPLCAIYEPGSAAAIAARIDSGKSCPRKFLIQSDALLLEQPDPRALDNINTPGEYGAALDTLRPDAQPDTQADNKGPAMQINVQYYALLREQAGRSQEALSTAARTPRELYQELKARHPFTLGDDSLRVAINAEFSDWTQPLAEGDSVVFIPPVAGG